MTVFEKQWKTIGNWPLPPSLYGSVAQATAYYCWWLSRLLKNTALGQAANLGAWAVEYSCDSVTAGTAADGVDRWGDTFDVTKVVQGVGAAAVRSWIVMSKTIQSVKWYCCIEVGTVNAGGGAYNVAMFFSNNAFTGGTTQARPTSTTEWGYGNPSGSGAGAGTPGMQYDCFNSTTTTTAHKLHGNLASDGNWMFYVSKDSTGALCASSMFQVFSTISGNTHAGDLCPAFSMHFSANGGGTSGLHAWATANTSSILSAPGTIISAQFASRDPLNTKQVPLAALGIVLTASGVFLTSGQVPGADGADGYFDDYPIILLDQFTNSIRGRIVDIAFAPNNLGEGAVEPPGAATFASCIFGNTWHPWILSSPPSM